MRSTCGSELAREKCLDTTFIQTARVIVEVLREQARSHDFKTGAILWDRLKPVPQLTIQSINPHKPAGLVLPQPCIQTAVCQQFGMGAAFRNLAAFQNHQAIHAGDCG
jgi:hypothetical protein